MVVFINLSITTEIQKALIMKKSLLSERKNESMDFHFLQIVEIQHTYHMEQSPLGQVIMKSKIILLKAQNFHSIKIGKTEALYLMKLPLGKLS
jgi:hypothetical protein